MPRSIWNGTVTFGSVVVPVKVHSVRSRRPAREPEPEAPDDDLLATPTSPAAPR